MYVIPAEGLKVPDPVLRDYLPAHGRNVTPSAFWTARLLDGDVRDDPKSITQALAAVTKVRDAAKSVRDAAKAKRDGLAEDAPARPAADEALAAAEAALGAAEALVADVAPHVPAAKPAPRSAGQKE